MVFMGYTQKSVAYMLKHSHFYEPLPDKYIDSAFLDRINAFNPGWEVQPVRHELFCTGYGFLMDYIAEVLKHLRTEDYTGVYKPHFEISSEVSTRDQTGFEKTFSGLMKIVHPNCKATPDEIAELLEFTMECRRRVREQILRIDDTFKANDFAFKPFAGEAAVTVLTPEERQYPQFAGNRLATAHSQPPESQSKESSAIDEQQLRAAAPETDASPVLAYSSTPVKPLLQEHHVVVPENAKGWSYRRLFGDYLAGATQITVVDPYIRAFHQIRNMVEFLRMVNELTPEGDEAAVHLITATESESKEKLEKQIELLEKIQDSFAETSTPFSFEISASPNFHARSIRTDTGWKITLDRGLDIFQWFEHSAFNAATNLQEARLTKGCELSFIRQTT